MNGQALTFKAAVEETPGLGATAFHAGLQALKATDRARIDCAETRKLSGRVDVDTSLEPLLKNEHRWDYAIGYRQNGEVIYWVEVHPASPGDVAAVRLKLTWLKTWLNGDGRRLRPFTPRYVWVSSGKTTFTRTSPLLRRLAQEGLLAPGRILRIE